MAEPKIVEAAEPRRPPFTKRFNPDGNERLTAAVWLILIGLAVAELGTLVLGLQRFLHLHVFIGLVLLPVIAVKLASTGWRFLRYYTRNHAYRLKGPPQILMRLLAPLLVLATVLVFGSGVAIGLTHGQALAVARRIHGPAAFLWTVTLGAHVLLYALRALRAVAADVTARTRRQVEGAHLRWIIVTVAIVAGIAVGVATLPVQHDWLRLPHHHHEHDG